MMTVQFIEKDSNKPLDWLSKVENAIANKKIVSIVKNGEEVAVIASSKPVLRATLLVNGTRAEKLEEVVEAVETNTPVHWVDGRQRYPVINA